MNYSYVDLVPNKCIETAEYLIRCGYYDGVIPVASADGVKVSGDSFVYASDYQRPVSVDLYKADGNTVTCDLDTDDLNSQISPNYSTTQLTNIIGLIEARAGVGTGLCVVSNGTAEGVWRIHAATMIAAATSSRSPNWGYFFANDDVSPSFQSLKKEYATVREFIEKYRDAVNNSGYSVGFMYST